MRPNSIIITSDTLSEGRRLLCSELAKTKSTDKEVNTAQLLMEELFFRLKKGMDGGADFSVVVSLHRSLGETNVRMEAKGIEYNPIPAVTEHEDGDTDEAYRLAILKYNRQKFSCVRKNSTNIVTIRVHNLDSTKKQLINTVSALLLGVICGLIMQAFMDSAMIATVTERFISPVRNIFFNALHMMMAPVTFFAIISGVTNISDAALVGKLGGRMVVVAMFMQVLIAALGIGLGIAIFRGDLSYIQAGISSAGETASVPSSSLLDMLLGIVPKNLIDPFRGDNILQVMFLAIFFGIIINQMGEKAKGAVECIDFVFRFAIAVLKIIVKTIPVMVFLSMSALLATTGISSLVAFSGLFGGLILGVIGVWLVCALTILLFGKFSPWPAIKKLLLLSPLLFSVSSSHARLPFVLKFCSDKLGIDSKLATFSIPVGVQLNKAGSCIFFALMTLLMMRVYNIDLPFTHLVTLWVSVGVMSIAKPPIPCAGVICLAYLFSVVGVPADAISVVLCVEPLAAMFNGVCNESSNITTTLVVSKEAGMFDKQIYFTAK